jgi:peroxiredoxin
LCNTINSKVIEGGVLMTKLNEAFPAISLTNLEGESVSIESYRGKKLLIYMWASW